MSYSQQLSQPPHKFISSWNNEDVLTFLDKLNVPQKIKETFSDLGVTGYDLCLFSDLKDEMKYYKFQERNLFLKSFKEAFLEHSKLKH
jgi:hypothetical protein